VSAVADVVRADASATFGVSGTGLHVVAGPPSRILVWRVGDDLTIVAADPAVLDRVRAAVAAVGDPFSRDALETIAGDGWEVFGPSIHSFADASTFRPVAPVSVSVSVSRVSLADLASFRSAADPDEWAEGGFGHDEEGGALVYGARDEDGVFVAAGNLTPWRAMPADVGLYVAPSCRGRGLGRAVASAMVADLLPTIGVARYRALETNLASLAVARSLGFVPHAANLVARAT